MKSKKKRIFPPPPPACWRGAPPACWPSEPPVARAARGLPCAALRAPAIQVHILEPSKNMLPIIHNTQLDKLNNSRLHTKVSTAHNQPGAAPALALIPAPAADAAAAARADPLEPNAAAECLFAPVVNAALLLLLPLPLLLLKCLAPPLPLRLLATAAVNAANAPRTLEPAPARPPRTLLL